MLFLFIIMRTNVLIDGANYGKMVGSKQIQKGTGSLEAV